MIDGRRRFKVDAGMLIVTAEKQTTSSGRAFHIRGAETLKDRLDRSFDRRQSERRHHQATAYSARRPGRSATRSSGPTYRGAMSCKTL